MNAGVRGIIIEGHGPSSNEREGDRFARRRAPVWRGEAPGSTRVTVHGPERSGPAPRAGRQLERNGRKDDPHHA